MITKARVIAFYLPQFHPVEVNDKYWGKGFTEWTNVAKAKPVYRGQYQPQIPADLGFYDLRLPEVRKAQADMAREAGIEGFCYWYYWFGRGKKVLEMPITEMLRTHQPNFPFCVGWANHDWSNKTWQKAGRFTKDIIFLKQEYLGEDDYKDFFYDLLPAFKDERYIRVENKPVFYVFDSVLMPDIDVMVRLWNKLARENGMEGVYFIARAEAIGHITVRNKKKLLNDAKEWYDKLIKMGYNAVNSSAFRRAELITNGISSKIYRAIKKKILGYTLQKYDYEKLMDNYYMDEDRLPYVYPQVTPRKDKTPRVGKNALIYSGSTPEKFRRYVRKALICVENRDEDHRIIFLDSWNEWGEGSYMEPDICFGHQYLDVLREELVINEKK